MSRQAAMANNPLTLENVSRSVDLATNLRPLFERGGSAGIRKQSTIRLEWLRPNPDQPRKQFDPASMESLKNSILAQGILQPIVVRLKEDHYEILCGERRFRAATELGLSELPVVVREATDTEALILGLQENIQRNDLTPIEEAHAYQQLLEKQIASSQRDLAKLVGISQARVSQKLALLELPEEIQSRVITRLSPGTSAGLTERHVRAVRRLTDPSGQKLLVDQILAQNLSVDQTETLVEQVLANVEPDDSTAAHHSANSGKRPTRRRIKHWSIGAALVRQDPSGITIRIRDTTLAQQVALLQQVLAELTQQTLAR